MATLSPVIVPGKALTDGRHKIRIAVSHNGMTRYIVTNLVIDALNEFKNGCVVKRGDASMMNTKLRGILQRYQNIIDETEYINSLSCPELIFTLKHAGEKKNRTLKSIFEEYITSSIAKDSTKRLYNSYWNTIKCFVNENTLMQNITHATVISLDKAFRKNKLKDCSIRNKMVFFSSLVTFAKKYGYVQYTIDPFVGYKKPNATVRDAWVTREDIIKIRDADLNSITHSKWRDYFMLSYYLGGINLADLLKINFKKHPNKIKYIRQKTERHEKVNKYVEFDIPEEAKPIIKRYLQPNGQLQKIYKVPAIKELHDLVECENFVFYSARKSFSQHAFSLGIHTSVIDYILGHSLGIGKSSLYAYIRVTPKMATRAIRQVLDNLK